MLFHFHKYKLYMATDEANRDSFPFLGGASKKKGTVLVHVCGKCGKVKKTFIENLILPKETKIL